MPIRIENANANFEREPLRLPYGFKGGRVSELWQSIVLLESEGHRTMGLGTQSVLWSDSDTFAAHTETGGNALMFAVTEWAVQAARQISFDDPIDLIDALLPEALDYARKITGRQRLRETFALNALVGLDLAAWLLYARVKNLQHFDEMIPRKYRSALTHRNDRIAFVPSVGYGESEASVARLAGEGCLCFKIKLGHPGDPDEMLRRDMERLEFVHRILGPLVTKHAETGSISYYLDANGRYPQKETLRRLLDHADKVGALDRVAIVEEPFPEDYEEEVDDLGVRIAADESAHTDVHTRNRIALGYRAIALKPVAKTLSMTLKIAQTAHELNVPCLCADLTVNPILVDWNKVIAARLAPFPGLGMGLLETNGHQYYRNWSTMQDYHPHAGATWTRIEEGVFKLGQDFYEHDGGIFSLSPHYSELVHIY